MIVTPGTGRNGGWGQVLTVAFGLVAFGVGWYGVDHTHYTGTDMPPDWADAVYRSLQLFVLDGAALQDLKPLHWTLQVARFAAPSVTVAAVLLGLRALFADRWRRWWISHRRNHIVVCGSGATAAALARNAGRPGRGWSGRRDVVVVLVTPDAADAPTGVPTVLGDPGDQGVLRAAGLHRATAVFVLGGSGADSTAISIAAAGVERGLRSPLVTSAEVDAEDSVDPVVQMRIAEDRSGPMFVPFVADDIAAGSLLGEHQPTGAEAIVVGTGPLADAVRRAIERGVPDSTPRKARDLSGDTTAATGSGPVYVCSGQPAGDQLMEAMTIAGGTGRDVVLAAERAEPFATLHTRTGQVSVFGVLDRTWTTRAIVDGTVVGRIARAIHESFQAAAPDGWNTGDGWTSAATPASGTARSASADGIPTSWTGTTSARLPDTRTATRFGRYRTCSPPRACT